MEPMDPELPQVLVGNLLHRRGLTLAVAESLTGGLICHLLTNVPGSSDYFLEGLVTYSNQAKIRALGVAEELISSQGAVSPQVAQAMARGVRRVTGADLGLASTGIAGPGGATVGKPVGLVYLAIAAENETLAQVYHLPGNRLQVKEAAAREALLFLGKWLKESFGADTN